MEEEEEEWPPHRQAGLPDFRLLKKDFLHYKLYYHTGASIFFTYELMKVLNFKFYTELSGSIPVRYLMPQKFFFNFFRRTSKNLQISFTNQFFSLTPGIPVCNGSHSWPCGNCPDDIKTVTWNRSRSERAAPVPTVYKQKNGQLLNFNKKKTLI